MLRGGMPVRKVATALGYASPGSFATAFRRATGLLPSEIGRNGRTVRAS
jgi:AraC-like DNA-binding protein